MMEMLGSNNTGCMDGRWKNVLLCFTQNQRIRALSLRLEIHLSDPVLEEQAAVVEEHGDSLEEGTWQHQKNMNSVKKT